jgi:hypothetical protein
MSSWRIVRANSSTSWHLAFSKRASSLSRTLRACSGLSIRDANASACPAPISPRSNASRVFGKRARPPAVWRPCGLGGPTCCPTCATVRPRRRRGEPVRPPPPNGGPPPTRPLWTAQRSRPSTPPRPTPPQPNRPKGHRTNSQRPGLQRLGLQRLGLQRLCRLPPCMRSCWLPSRLPSSFRPWMFTSPKGASNPTRRGALRTLTAPPKRPLGQHPNHHGLRIPWLPTRSQPDGIDRSCDDLHTMVTNRRSTVNG